MPLQDAPKTTNSYASIGHNMGQGKTEVNGTTAARPLYREDEKQQGRKEYLLAHIEFETRKLREFYTDYLKKEFTLNQSLVVTAEKLNLFVNALIECSDLYQLDIKCYIDLLALKTNQYYAECKNGNFNHFNFAISSILTTIQNCLFDLQQDINEQLNEGNIPVDAQNILHNYFALMMHFQSNGASRMDIYACPNPGMVNQAEVEQQGILERAYSMLRV